MFISVVEIAVNLSLLCNMLITLIILDAHTHDHAVLMYIVNFTHFIVDVC